MSGANERQRAIRTGCGVSKLRRAVAANAVSSDRFDAEVEFLVENRHQRAGADAAAGVAAVRGAKAAHRCGRSRSAGYLRQWRHARDEASVVCVCSHHAARIAAVAEKAHDAEQLVVTPAGIGSRLEDEVRRLVHSIAVSVKRVVQTAARTRGVDKEVPCGGGCCAGGDDGGWRRSRVDCGHRGEAAAADSGLRSFNRDAESKLVSEVLHETHAVLASPREAYVVLWVNHHGKVFLPVEHKLFVFRG